MALVPLAPIDRATLAYVAVALAFQLARGPRTWPAVVLIAGRGAEYDSDLRSPTGRTEAHGEAS